MDLTTRTVVGGARRVGRLGGGSGRPVKVEVVQPREHRHEPPRIESVGPVGPMAAARAGPSRTSVMRHGPGLSAPVATVRATNNGHLASSSNARAPHPRLMNSPLWTREAPKSSEVIGTKRLRLPPTVCAGCISGAEGRRRSFQTPPRPCPAPQKAGLARCRTGPPEWGLLHGGPTAGLSVSLRPRPHGQGTRQGTPSPRVPAINRVETSPSECRRG
jgi:hypothetical protein